MYRQELEGALLSQTFECQTAFSHSSTGESGLMNRDTPMQYLVQAYIFPFNPQLDSYSQITPLAAFVSDDGKKVLPFLSRQTRGGNDIAQRKLCIAHSNLCLIYWMEPLDHHVDLVCVV